MYFSETETARRRGMLHETMDDLGLEAVVLLAPAPSPTAQEEFYFLQNDYIASGLSATVVPRTGDPTTISPYLQSLSHAQFSTSSDCRVYGETQSPAALLGDVLTEKGISAGRVGWRWSNVPAYSYEHLRGALPDVEWVDISGAFKDMWYRKSSEEAEAGLRSAELAAAGYRHLLEVIEPGMTEWDVVTEFESFTFRNGANRNFTIVASGPLESGRAFPELRPATRRRLEPGDLVMMEMTPAVSGFYTQLVRTIAVGPATDQAQQLKDVAVTAIRAATGVLRPGATVGQVASALKSAVEAAGFGTSFPFGHTVGVDLVLDRLLPDLDRVLHENDTVIIHPRVHTPDGHYSFFWGETYLVTAAANIRMGGVGDALESARLTLATH
ncbi:MULTISPECIES: M24 family metallopeptidase [Streptomyces]|uniref:M24 family metallopeptidase n=2 Tax=Streptomyces TaxID=1883 RepID=A0ABV9J7J9_9ACTN